MLLNAFVDTLGAIAVIGLFIAFLYGFVWIISFMSKASGKTIVRRGKVMYTPGDFDHINKLPKDLAVKLKQTVSKLPDRIHSMKALLNGEKVTDKLKALKELTELKEKGTITDNEFNVLKERIMR